MNKLRLTVSFSTISISLLVIIGWCTSTKGLLSLIPGGATMKFNTALCFLLLGIGILCTPKSTIQKLLAKIAAISIGIIGITSFLSYYFDFSFSLDNLFVYDSFSVKYNGRMSVATGTCFFLCGVGILGSTSKVKWIVHIIQHLLFIVSIISLLSICTFILQIPTEHKFFFINTMAIHTAVLFFFISISISLKHHKIGFNSLVLNSYTGGKLFKQITPLIIILPLIMSYLLIYCINNKVILSDIGIVIYTVVFIISGLAYVGIISYKMTLIDKKRIRLESSLAAMMEEREQFVYITSHDLQEPLKTVMSFTHKLKEENFDQLDTNGKQGLNFIINASDRMSHLVKGLMEYCLIGRSKEKKHTNLNNVIASIQDTLKTHLLETDAKIIYKNLPILVINENDIINVFQNLISNAIKFKSPDRPPVIEIKSKEIAGYWLFYVKDNGIGIPERYKKKIFVIFQRLHSHKRYPGTGIGLAQCKKVIDQLGGKLWVESKEGKGSTFFFTIPVNTESYGKN